MMPVYIKEINVQNLGPISQLTVQLGMFNLIYGRNEKGKTYLVEFLIRSLFRSARLWQLRSQKGVGKVRVEGLRNGIVDFFPSSTKKLEDFWGNVHVGLPPDFSKLLVVKGAEVEIANVEGGVDKAILKRYLSSKEILENIERNISKTIQESEIENKVIKGPKRGEINAREELEKNLKAINHLFDQIDKEYSGGYRKALADERQELQKQLNQLLKAKQFLAFQIDQQIKNLKSDRNRIANEKLQNARSDLTLYKQKISEYRKKKQTQHEAEIKSQHYEWLLFARDLYQNMLKKEVGRPHPVFLILSVIMVTLTGIFIFLKIPIAAILALVGVILFGLLYIQKYQTMVKQAVENEEIEKLQKEFKNNFEQELTGLPQILEMLQKMEEDYTTGRLLKKQLSEDVSALESLQMKISERFYELTGERKEPETWDDVLRQLDSKLLNLENQIHEKEVYLAQLGVDPSDYKTEKPEVEYSKEKFDKLQDKLRYTEEQIDEEIRKLSSLKQLICQQTGDDISINWETLINNLRTRRDQVLEDYKDKTAEILGKIAVHEVIKELRKAEDTKILTGLKSSAIQEPLYQVTKRYNSLTLDGDKLIVSDPFNNFYLSELSTGAQEQILLALRIGFSTRIMKQDHLFLILDDAFQYSDWERRKLLTEKVVDLAKNGWQILYFTMDDNLRDLFEEKGKLFGDQYKRVELTS